MGALQKTFGKVPQGTVLNVLLNWILQSGLWDDSKKWMDNAVWID